MGEDGDEMTEWILGGLALVALVFLAFDWLAQDTATTEQVEDRQRRFK